MESCRIHSTSLVYFSEILCWNIYILKIKRVFFSRDDVPSVSLTALFTQLRFLNEMVKNMNDRVPFETCRFGYKIESISFNGTVPAWSKPADQDEQWQEVQGRSQVWNHRQFEIILLDVKDGSD